MSLFKVGDIVTIKQREGHGVDYPCNFTDEMCIFVGKSFKIVAVNDLSDRDKPKYNGDAYYYHLEGNSYNWHSSMFEDKKKNKNSFCYKVYKHKKLEITL